MIIMNVNSQSFWREVDNQYIGLVPVPGVAGANVSQSGKVITINGRNDNLHVSYSYSVTLHPDATDIPQIREENGMIVITCPKVSAIRRQLLGAPDASGVRIIPEAGVCLPPN